MSNLREAFHLICKEAKETDPHYVVLVSSYRAYGGPEDGGWWYDVSAVEAYQQFPTLEQAEEVAEQVKKTAEELTNLARGEHGDYCLRSMEWLEARGLDADYLPEPDGPTEYRVSVCSEIPTFENRRPHYE